MANASRSPRRARSTRSRSTSTPRCVTARVAAITNLDGGRWSKRSVADSPLQQDDVAPVARRVTSDALLDPDPAEPDPLVERQACRVLREDAGHQGPDAGRLRRRDHGVEERPADATASGRLRDVDALPGDAGVDLAGRVAADRRPAHDGAIESRDEPAVAA